jgi:hypothetical protein
MKSIQLEGPGFYGEFDENLFFQCLYNLPSFKEVKGEGTVLTIYFLEEISEEVDGLINALCLRWETSKC